MTERFGGKNSVWGTGDVFWDLHADGNQFGNTEGIWVMPFMYDPADGYANHRGGRCWGNAYFRLYWTPDKPRSEPNAPWSAFMGEQRPGGNAWPSPIPTYTGTYNGYSDTIGRGVSWVHPTNLTAYYIWEGNWDNDYRNAKHMIKRDFYYDNPKSSFHGKKINMKVDYADWYKDGLRDLRDDTCQRIFPFFLKQFDPCNIQSNAPTSGNGDSFKDIYVMRLAETYLSRAEAYIGLNELAKAVDDINVVRKRSNAKLVTVAEIGDKAAVLDYLLDERIRELYSEECRHIVLRRTGTLLERTRKYNNNPARAVGSGLNIKEKHLLWPIPQSEIDKNIGNKWEQNPLY
jgi:hypothetical protein